MIFRGSEKRRTYTEFIEDAEITEKRSVAWVGEGLTPEGVSYRLDWKFRMGRNKKGGAQGAPPGDEGSD